MKIDVTTGILPETGGISDYKSTSPLVRDYAKDAPSEQSLDFLTFVNQQNYERQKDAPTFVHTKLCLD